MGLTKSKAVDNNIFNNLPEKIYEFNDENIGLQSYIVIDTLNGGSSCGGLRISSNLTLDELKILAKIMTIKYSFLKRKTGGAKAGIILPKDCSSEQKTKILEAFGQKASELLRKGLYVPWTDMNSNIDDISLIMRSAGCKYNNISDSSYFTALTVVSSIKAACEIKNIDMSKTTVSIEGFGNVGTNIANELKRYGMKIIGISTLNGTLYDNSGLDVDKLIDIRKKYQDELVKHYPANYYDKTEPLLEMETDILVPCAGIYSINNLNMNKIRTKMIIPGANAPLTREAELFLHNKGILYIPGFISNIGGVFGTSLYDNNIPIKKVYNFIMKEYGFLIKNLIWSSFRNNCLPSKIAYEVAMKNFNGYNNSRNNNNSYNKKYLRHFLQIGLNTPRYIPLFRPYMTLLNQKIILNSNIKSIIRIHNF